MKTSVKIVIILFIVGVLGAGILLDTDKKKEIEKTGKVNSIEEEIIKSIARDLRYKGVVLQNYYFTTNRSLEEAFGIEINREKVVFAIIDIPSYSGTLDKVERIIALAESVFNYDNRTEGVVVLFIEPERTKGYVKFIYIDKEEFFKNKEKGLASIRLYNTFEFFEVPKEKLEEEDLQS